MPQLDFSVFPSQLFWLCVTFFTMLFVMSKFIIPRIAEMINLRKEKIDDYLEKAAEIKVQAEAALDKYQQALKFATEEANQSIAKTQQDLKNMIERKQSDLDNELAAQIAEGEKKNCRQQTTGNDAGSANGRNVSFGCGQKAWF